MSSESKIAAKRLDHFQTGIFAELNDKKDEMEQKGKHIYNLSVGTPDFEPPKHIMDAVLEAASKPENYKYSLRDIPELLEAVSAYYKIRFGVEIAPDQIQDFVRNNSLGIADIKKLEDMEEAIRALLTGNAIFFIDGYDKAMKISSKGYPSTGVMEAESEKVLRGSREGFSDSDL